MPKQPWDNFFVPEDFAELGSIMPDEWHDKFMKGRAANITNAKLAREAEKWPVVFGDENGCDSVRQPLDTHTARLAFIQPIVKPECRHEPISREYLQPAIASTLLTQFTNECRHCGVRLKMPSEWRAE